MIFGKNTTAHILMKALKIVYHSHLNYAVCLLQVFLIKTNRRQNVLGHPCWHCPWKRLWCLLLRSGATSHLSVPPRPEMTMTFLTSAFLSISLSSASNASCMHSFCLLIQVYLQISMFTALRLLSSLQCGFSQLISLRSAVLVKRSITVSKTIVASVECCLCIAYCTKCFKHIEPHLELAVIL